MRAGSPMGTIGQTAFYVEWSLEKRIGVLLLEDEEHGGSLVAIFALANEHNPDPEMRPYKDPISAELRETLIVSAAAGTMQIYRYFKAQQMELPVSQFPLGAYPPSKYLRINSRLRSLRRILRQSPLRLLGITGDRECCAPACSREASCPNLHASRPSFHSRQLGAPPVRGARPR